eukprot:c24790_g1_i1 orf=66-962(+)
MANQRQRLARRRFRGAFCVQNHVEAARVGSFANLEAQKKDGSGNAGKRMKAFGKSSVDKSFSLAKKLSKGSKHPLRLPGRRPGEGCFICKATNHTAKTCAERKEKDRNKICLFCRETGHRIKNCPNKSPKQATKFCYNCGEIGHRLSECTKPIKNGGTSFAECFLCKQEGHVSKDCPSNCHGIYPKGGSCKNCGGVTHLAKDCPKKEAGRSTAECDRLQLGVQPFEDRKHVIFRSGDDLEDDFTEEMGKNGIDRTGGGCSTVDHKINRKKELRHKGGKGKVGRGKFTSKQKLKVIDFF